MRKLERGEAPACLSKYEHGRDNWNSTSKSCRDEIRGELKKMQGFFCAYCESHLGKHDKRHIEHFYQASKAREMTFDWKNLFWSCDALDSCGKYKDHKAVSSIELSKVCKPDELDPAEFFIFTDNGNVKLQLGLSSMDTQIAENTILVFNLNGSSRLVGKRRETMRSAEMELDAFRKEMADCEGDLELESLLEELLEEKRIEVLSTEKKVAHYGVLRQVWDF